MPNVFSYAVIRVVPRVDRDEFLNVGVVLYCHARRYLQVKLAPNWPRLSAAFPHADRETLEQHLDAFVAIAHGTADSPIARLGVSERFHWLTSARSTIIQTSPVHPGTCDNLDAALDRLLEKLVSIV